MLAADEPPGLIAATAAPINMPPDPALLQPPPNSKPPPRQPKFLGVLPMRVGGHLLMLQMLLRGALFIVAGVTLVPSDGTDQSTVAKYLFIVVGSLDILTSLFGWFAVLMDDVDKMKVNALWKVVSLAFFLPYLTGYLLFGAKVGTHLSALVVAAIVVGVLLLEGVLLRELYKLLLYTMRINKYRDEMGNRFEMPDWLRGDPDNAYVLFKTVSITAAVQGYALFTLISSFVGILCVLFFPNVAILFGFYSERASETSTLLFLTNAGGVFFSLYCLAAIQHGQPEELRTYLLYQLFRFCVMIPIVVVNSVNNNTCGMYRELQETMGVAARPSASATETAESSQITFHCNGREQLYWCVVVGVMLVHAYFVWTSYLLYVRYSNHKEAEKAKEAALGNSKRTLGAYGALQQAAPPTAYLNPGAI
mmetsp:Transcript_7768/g.18814  ORF Transcript_7768/g.18814 Transcript_7768/m.18814 type:complete len:421 (+) Transcript_7768:130-1392(+)|eukprot:CAMPEP_0178994732 /NCGR_PEP_ID=MMETSP0795-20121207/7432_1 /TAXON_ID=88552 /ORGANISM="Amoebophrya sp., Strain Ameob2" /LENGTH=420 /DNA_ID=CAMNT_0020686955 /DNA_START=112 /DNA_END=1374 /DNA_ORIENTATION=+